METATANGHGSNGGRTKRGASKESFGKALTAARKARRIVARDLANEIKVALGTLYSWEAGKNLPRASAVGVLRKKFPELPELHYEAEDLPGFAPPPAVRALPPTTLIAKPHLATEATTATLADYGQAVAEIVKARQALDNAIARAEAIHTAIMGKVKP